jgi:hypothetical protein
MSMNKMRWAAMCGLVLLAVPGAIRAGYVSLDWGGCTKDASGSGYCYGTMRGFKNGPDINDRAEFYSNHDGIVSFYGRWAGQTYSCVFPIPSTPTVREFASFVAATNGFFVVMFNASGGCTYGYAYRGSGYGSDF